MALNNCFINPYTFIPIPGKEPDRKDFEKTMGNLTGYLECSMEIKSPTFIPNTTKRFETDVKEHYKYDFYSYEDLSKKDFPTEPPKHPVIPGSEIRGMIRNVYEQLTNSCFPVVDENNWPYKRTNEPKIPALLEYDKEEKAWYLCHAVSSDNKIAPIETKKLFCEGDFIKIKPNYCGLKYDIRRKCYKDTKSGRDDNTEYRIGDTAYLIDCFKGIKKDGKRLTKVPSADGEKIIIEKVDSLKRQLEGKKDVYKYKNESYSVGDKIYCKLFHNNVVDFNKKNSMGYEEYCLHLMPLGVNKKYMLLYRKDTSGLSRRRLSDNDMQRLMNVIASYQNKKVNKAERTFWLFAEYEKLIRNHETVLVYTNVGSLKDYTPYLSPCCMTKEYFNNTIDKILEKQYKHNKCSDAASACPACRLFGMIGDNGSITSRLRFADATETSGNPEFDKTIRVLPILGTPKISATEFYLKKPILKEPAATWNYDYYTNYTTDNGVTVYHRNTYDPKLSGRKVYWHGEIKTGDKIEPKNLNMTCTVRAITKGEFGFKVYYENITEDELKKLIFCLILNGEGIHKIGRGKPVGMGDNKIAINAVKTRTYSIAYGKLTASWNDITPEYKDYILTPETNEAKQILIYTNKLSDNEKTLVGYPRADEQSIFKWFSDNRGSVNAPKIKHTLPEIGSDKKLPLNPESNSRPGNGGGGSNQPGNGSCSYQPRSGGGEPSRFGNGSADSQPRSGSGGHPQNRGYGNGRQNTQSIDFDAAIKNMGKKNK